MKILKKNKFSIIIPNYNGEKYLKICLDAIINQNYKNYEIFVVDGKSSDNSHKILNEYSAFINRINEPDMGISDAFNKALEYTSGDFILYLGSDDILYNNNVLYSINQYINKIIQINDKSDRINRINIATPSISYFPDTGKYVKIDNSDKEFTVNQLIKNGNLCGLQNIFFNRHGIIKHKLNVYHKFAMDYDVYFRLLNNDEHFIRYDKITTINIQGNNISNTNYFTGFCEVLKIARSYTNNINRFFLFSILLFIYLLCRTKNFIFNLNKGKIL